MKTENTRNSRWAERLGKKHTAVLSHGVFSTDIDPIDIKLHGKVVESQQIHSWAVRSCSQDSDELLKGDRPVVAVAACLGSHSRRVSVLAWALILDLTCSGVGEGKEASVFVVFTLCRLAWPPALTYVPLSCRSCSAHAPSTCAIYASSAHLSACLPVRCLRQDASARCRQVNNHARE